MTVEKMIDALDSVTWYNGLFDAVIEWKKLGAFSSPPHNYGGLDAEEKMQLQVIWMICVCLFGDYGTSPRYGWIIDTDGFYDFIDKITATYKEAKENEEEEKSTPVR